MSTTPPCCTGWHAMGAQSCSATPSPSPSQSTIKTAEARYFVPHSEFKKFISLITAAYRPLYTWRARVDMHPSQRCFLSAAPMPTCRTICCARLCFTPANSTSQPACKCCWTTTPSSSLTRVFTTMLFELCIMTLTCRQGRDPLDACLESGACESSAMLIAHFPGVVHRLTQRCSRLIFEQDKVSKCT